MKKIILKKIIYLSFYFFSTLFIISFFSRPYKYRNINKNFSFFIFLYDYFNFILNELKLVRNFIFKFILKIIKIYLIYKIILFLNICAYELVKDIIDNTFLLDKEKPIVIYVPYTTTYKEYFDVSIDPFKYIANNIDYNLFFLHLFENFPIFFYFIFNLFFNSYFFIVLYFYTKNILSLLKSFWFYYYIFFFILLKIPIWFTSLLYDNRDLWCFTVCIFIFIYLFLILYFFKNPYNILNSDNMFLGELNRTSFEIKGPSLIYLGSIYFFILCTITIFLYITDFLPLTDKDFIASAKLDPYFIHPSKK